MSGLARLMLRGRTGQVAALAVTVFFSATVVGAFAVLLETGTRGQVSTGEYRNAPLLIAARQSTPVSGDVDLATPGRAVLPAAVVADLHRALPGSRIVTDRIVPAAFQAAGSDSEPADVHPWAAFALGDRTLSAGHAPHRPDEMVLPRELARSYGLNIGSRARLGFGDEAVEYTVVGTTTADDRGVDAPDVYLDDAQIAAHGNPDHRVAAIGVWPSTKPDARALDRLVVRDGARLWQRDHRGPLEVVSQGRAKADLVSSAAALGAIALIVAVFTVMALTSLQVRQRSRELAMLRVVGATPRQVKRLLRAEIHVVAGSMALLGGVAGPALGVVLVGAIRSWGVVPRTLHPVLGPLPVVLAALAAFAAAEVAARVALRRVVRGSPLPHLDDGDDAARAPRVVRRTIIGLAVLALGAVMALAPLYTSNVDVATGLPGLSGLVMALSIGPLSPAVVRVAGWIVRRPATRDPAAYLALQSIRHRAARVGGALSPIVLGVALGTVQLSGSATTGAVASAQHDAGSRADLTVSSDTTGVGERTVRLVRDAAGVGAVTPYVSTDVIVHAPAGTGNGPQTLAALGIAGDEPGRYADLEPTDSRPIHLRHGEVALGVLGAAELGAQVGDSVTVVLPDGQAITRRVRALYRRGLGFGEVLLPIGDLQSATATGAPSGLAVTVAASEQKSAVVRRLNDRLTNHPGIRVVGLSKADAGRAPSGGDRFGLLILLVLFGYIAIAVTNSLVTATLARRSELALLAAVGTTPRQLRRVWRWDAAFLAVTACLVGTAFALPGLISMTYALSNGDRSAPALDPVAYGAIVAFVIVLVLVATALPARTILRAQRQRASRRGSDDA